EIQNLEIEKATEKETSSPVKEQDLVVQKADAKSSEKVVSGKVESTEEKVLSAEENLALVKPKALDVFDASNEPDNVELPENALLEKSDFETKFLVSRENKFKEFDFHYQFKSNTLILYGNFDDTYEILDLNKNGNRAIYLYYKGAYHALDVDQVTIIRLSALNDSTIIEQLDNLRKKEGN
ncbi:MAG: hypothetical protein OEY51_14965, partial [Cyclobacteriaceae bacterium]|nr:hypothetical protein [Cyclobacteriaceae bacterium]